LMRSQETWYECQETSERHFGGSEQRPWHLNFRFWEDRTLEKVSMTIPNSVPTFSYGIGRLNRHKRDPGRSRKTNSWRTRFARMEIIRGKFPKSLADWPRRTRLNKQTGRLYLATEDSKSCIDPAPDSIRSLSLKSLQISCMPITVQYHETYHLVAAWWERVSLEVKWKLPVGLKPTQYSIVYPAENPASMDSGLRPLAGGLSVSANHLNQTARRCHQCDGDLDGRASPSQGSTLGWMAISHGEAGSPSHSHWDTHSLLSHCSMRMLTRCLCDSALCFSWSCRVGGPFFGPAVMCSAFLVESLINDWFLYCKTLLPHIHSLPVLPWLLQGWLFETFACLPVSLVLSESSCDFRMVDVTRQSLMNKREKLDHLWTEPKTEPIIWKWSQAREIHHSKSGLFRVYLVNSPLDLEWVISNCRREIFIWPSQMNINWTHTFCVRYGLDSP